MSSTNNDGKSGSRRRSLFNLSPLTPLTGNGKDPPKTLKRRRQSNLFGTTDSSGESAAFADLEESPISPTATRPQLPRVGGSMASNSKFGSWRSKFSSDDIYEEPQSTVSSRPPSVNWGEFGEAGLRSRNVLKHGEVQTSGSLFRKKKEYLVLTETHLIRFKSQAKAAKTFTVIPPVPGRASNTRHNTTPSTGSSHEFGSAPSDNSGDRDGSTPLRQLVAVYKVEDGRPYFAVEIAYLDDESNHASSLNLQLGDPDERDVWLAAIRTAANNVRLVDVNPISEYNSTLAARVVDREKDYVPENYMIYKVVQRSSKQHNRSSSDDLAKIASSVCFLAIGVNKVHLIPLFRSARTGSTPSLGTYNMQASYGIMTLTELRLSDTDDTFELTFRMPRKPAKVLYLASLASKDIALRLRQIDERLRREWESRPYHFLVPDDVKREILRNSESQPIDLDSFDDLLSAYCVAYDCDPRNIRYQIVPVAEDSPCFQLQGPVDPRQQAYTAHELLAIMRALRYNESFGTLSFADSSLDALNGLLDHFGAEHVCTKTKRGTPVGFSLQDLSESSLLVQELRALALGSRKLRRMDFTSSIKREPQDYVDGVKTQDIGCGIAQALFPLCKRQKTNVDWIVLNNIQLGEADLDYLIGAAVERSCHFRAIELSNCGLNDRNLSLFLDALRAHEGTLECIDVSKNPARLSPSQFDFQLSHFGSLSKLNLSNISRTSGSEPLVAADTLLKWRLREFYLNGTAINEGTLDAICRYLSDCKSDSLRELGVRHTYIDGAAIARLMRALRRKDGTPRNLHLDISQNRIEQHLDALTAAIADNCAPQALTMQTVEYEDEACFRQLIKALTVNSTISYLDMSKASLPCELTEETSTALEEMFRKNKTIRRLDISGEDSRLEESKLGVGISQALRGLEENESLTTLIIQHQKLGLQGASVLADVLRVNLTLQEVYCDYNAIPLSGFTNLVASLHRNITLQHLPNMAESRAEALKKTELEVRAMRDDRVGSPQPKSVRTKFLGKQPKERPSSQLSDQDINAALRLVDESWERQTYLLEQYLLRNQRIANGLDVDVDIDQEEFEKPQTEGPTRLSQIMEQVKLDSTPTAEKELSFSEEREKRSSSLEGPQRSVLEEDRDRRPPTAERRPETAEKRSSSAQALARQMDQIFGGPQQR
ncbi:hypothetical protein H2201_005863 [Coniosporium apollinis]|uniref:PH domain-containing protein n=1 Tax=Coniosporium apollinis TaxID=61459 RepID=A0ABQ9NR10_9PEZI|nr:hypothetical protein H2201_005863 [Coniosporium apollinis]